MILEITCSVSEDEILLASWEFEPTIWNGKEKLVQNFIKTTIRAYSGEYLIKETTNNIVYKIVGKPNIFFNTQNRLNEYFDLLKVEKLIQ